MRRLLSRLELPPPDRFAQAAVTRVAAAGSGAALVAMVVAAIATGERAYYWQAIGPFLAGSTYLFQIRTRRENAVVSLVVAAVVMSATFTAGGPHDTALATLIALWAVAVAACFFVERRVGIFLSSLAVGFLVLPHMWSQVASPLSTGITLCFAFLMVASLVLSIRSGWARSERRFQQLFMSAPVGLMEQDWSDALELLRVRGIEDEATLVEYMADCERLADVIERVRVVRVNAKAASIAGVPARRLLGYLPRTRVHERSASSLREQLLAIWRGRPKFETEYCTSRFGGSGEDMWIRIEMVTTALRPHSERIVVAFTDVTESRRTQAELEALVRDKDDFIASISHELRTPLTGVLGLSTALVDGTVTDPDERSELLRLIMSQSQEVSYLVEDLLVGARADIGTIAIDSVDMDLAAEACEVLASLEDPACELDVRDPVRALADPVRVRQIVRNLAVNASRYGGPGRLAIVSERAGEAVFEMFDDGPGIPESARERIFEPYGRAHRQNGTTASVGLGLAVSRQLAELMAGTLEYRYDEGSVFRLTLPLSTAVPPEFEAPAASMGRSSSPLSQRRGDSMASP